MALVLGINIDKDNRVFIGPHMLTVDMIKSATAAQVTLHTAAMDYVYTLTTTEFTELTGMVGVSVGLGKDTNRGGLVRLLVDAPKNIAIERGSRQDG